MYYSENLIEHPGTAASSASHVEKMSHLFITRTFLPVTGGRRWPRHQGHRVQDEDGRPEDEEPGERSVIFFLLNSNRC